jgi:hypothetical protein
LREAYARRYEAGEANQVTLAEKLGIDKSAVHRRLTGRTNMTLETLADMAWALGHKVNVDIFDPVDRPTNSIIGNAPSDARFTFDHPMPSTKSRSAVLRKAFETV